MIAKKLGKDMTSALFLLAAFVFYGLTGLVYDTGSITSPSAGMFPRVVAIGGILTSIGFLLVVAKRSGGSILAWEGTREEIIRGALYVLSTIVLSALTSIIGHIISVSLMVAFNTWLLGMKWPYSFALGLGAGLAIFLVFGQWLEVGIIPGPFGF